MDEIAYQSPPLASNGWNARGQLLHVWSVFLSLPTSRYRDSELGHRGDPSYIADYVSSTGTAGFDGVADSWVRCRNLALGFPTTTREEVGRIRGCYALHIATAYIQSVFRSVDLVPPMLTPGLVVTTIGSRGVNCFSGSTQCRALPLYH